MQLFEFLNIVFLVIFFLAIVKGYIFLADKFNIVDNPTNRSSHTTPTMRGGGILFYISVVLFFVTSHYEYPYFMLGLSGIAVVSFIDDIKTLSAKIRFVFI